MWAISPRLGKEAARLAGQDRFRMGGANAENQLTLKWRNEPKKPSTSPLESMWVRKTRLFFDVHLGASCTSRAAAPEAALARGAPQEVAKIVRDPFFRNEPTQVIDSKGSSLGTNPNQANASLRPACRRQAGGFNDGSNSPLAGFSCSSSWGIMEPGVSRAGVFSRTS